MATDQTEVPIGTVLSIAAITIGTLVVVHVGITTYYHSMYGEESQRKVLGVSSTLLDRSRQDEERRLANLAQARQQVAAGLSGVARPAQIAPRPSTDLQALQGWQLRPRVVPNPPPARGDLPAGAETTPAPAAGSNTPAANPLGPGAAAPTAPTTVGATAAAHPISTAAPVH